jgi:mediator of RNA polymerase II transcription subunit 14
VYFQYDMGTAETVSKTVDALLSDWAQIVHLYTVVEDLAEYFRIGECSYFVICTGHF